MKLKKPKAAISNATTVIEPLPLKPVHTNTNVNILKIEKFNGNVAALRQHVSNQPPIPIRSALLTPGGHIRRNDFNKENEVECQDDNACDQNLSSDTLSMSGLLSSSKVQGNSTKTSLEDDNVNLAPVVVNDPVNQSTEITPTNSPIQNRSNKRNRSNDGTPSSSTPSITHNALDVYYNSKHRLTPSPRTQSNSSTPDTPRSKANLHVLFNPSHRLTPSPNQSKDHTTESINSTPVANSQYSHGLHSTQSTNFLGPSNSNARHFDHNLKSPRLLAQSNSQFSSVSDLREFAIKSSQSVISWPSQKLRTSSVKQFTIKNIGGKKLTMKIEVVGPGFQV